MYTHDETNIIYADALQPHVALQSNSYDVLVANPPYAVTGFLETLSESDRKEFTLFNGDINIAKNNAIDTFFYGTFGPAHACRWGCRYRAACVRAE